MVRDIKSSILGQRVANIYDLSDKIYLFKFAVPGVAKKVSLKVLEDPCVMCNILHPYRVESCAHDVCLLFWCYLSTVSEQIFLLVESGMRFHTTRYTRDKVRKIL